VAASNSQGDLSSFSNYGDRVDVSAPGGESWNGVWSLGNSGYTTASSESFRSMAGTSMAAPHVAGVLAMVYSLHPQMVVSQALEILQDGSQKQNTTSCSSGSYCGTGIVSAYQSLLLAQDASTAGVVDSYNPAPVVVGNQTEQNFTVQSKSGGCGSLSPTDGSGPGGNGFFLTLMLGMLIPLIASVAGKKKA
jgi:serine protease